MVQTERRELALCRGAAHPRNRIIHFPVAKVRIFIEKLQKNLVDYTFICTFAAAFDEVPRL